MLETPKDLYTLVLTSALPLPLPEIAVARGGQGLETIVIFSSIIAFGPSAGNQIFIYFRYK
jgi:hypothetical protein